MKTHNSKKIIEVSQNVIDLCEIYPGVAQIKMQDRGSKNEITENLSKGLNECFDIVNNDHNYKVAILTGYDNYFSTGGTQDTLLAIHEGRVKYTDNNFYRLIIDCKIPVIAAMQGHGIGAGLVLGLSCDFVVLSLESVYSANFMRYGFTPGMGATQVLPHKLGVNLANELLMTANNYTGAALLENGISIPVLPRKEVLQKAYSLANNLAEKPRDSLVILKKHLSYEFNKKFPKTVKLEVGMHEKTIHKPEVKTLIKSLFKRYSDSNVEEKKNILSDLQSGSINAAQAEMALKRHVAIAPKLVTEQARSMQNTTPRFPELVQLNKSQVGNPVFWIHSGFGGVESYVELADFSRRPFYGIQARGLTTKREPLIGIHAIAAYYVHIIMSVQPMGPYDLGGYSLGGVVAYEIARQLQELGEEVGSIVMIDSIATSEHKSSYNISLNSKILSVINSLLMGSAFRPNQSLPMLKKVLINRGEVQPYLMDNNDYINKLIDMAKQRGVKKSHTLIREQMEKNIKIGESYRINDYVVSNLDRPEDVKCFYFRNRNQKFYGDYEDCFVFKSEEVLLDDVNYWEVWQKKMFHLKLMDIDSDCHLTLLIDRRSLEQIQKFVKEMYS